MKQRFTIIIEDGISNKHMRAAMAKAAECILDEGDGYCEEQHDAQD